MQVLATRRGPGLAGDRNGGGRCSTSASWAAVSVPSGPVANCTRSSGLTRPNSWDDGDRVARCRLVGQRLGRAAPRDAITIGRFYLRRGLIVKHVAVLLLKDGQLHAEQAPGIVIPRALGIGDEGGDDRADALAAGVTGIGRVDAVGSADDGGLVGCL
jgi:hypothetical protein